MRFDVVLEGFVRQGEYPGQPPSDADMEVLLDGIMGELLKLKAGDPSIGATGSDGSITIKISVEALQHEVATVIGGSIMCTAAHAAGAGTPGWYITWLRTNAVDPDLVNA